MSYCGVSIFSVNLSGLTTQVTFFPQTGGTVDLGNQVFPFSYISDYFYGTYNCYVPTYAYTYTIVVPEPTPIITITPTNTQTPTITPSPTPTVTPTNTVTPTPTVTPTETPTNTPTNTSSSTTTPTPTVTPTNTVTPTSPLQEFILSSGTTLNNACVSTNTLTLYAFDSSFDQNTQFYNEPNGTVTIDLTGFFSDGFSVTELNSSGSQIGAFILCSVLPTPTPTINVTPTPT